MKAEKLAAIDEAELVRLVILTGAVVESETMTRAMAAVQKRQFNATARRLGMTERAVLEPVEKEPQSIG